MIGILMLGVGAWVVVGAIVWHNTKTPPSDDTSAPNCGYCDGAQRKWDSMDVWAKAATFLTYSGTILNCALAGCKITY